MSAETNIARKLTLVATAITVTVAALGLSGLSPTMYLLSPFIVGFGLMLTIGCAFVWLLLFVRGFARPPTSNSTPHPDARSSAAPDQSPSARAGGRER